MWLKTKVLDLRYFHIITNAILILLFYSRIIDKHGVPRLLTFFVALLYLALFWVKKDVVGKTYLVLISILIVISTLIIQYGYGIKSSFFLWPLVWYFAGLYGMYKPLPEILATLTIIIVLLMNFTYPFPYETFFSIVGLYLGIRSLRVRREAYRINKLHLEQLDKAHKELQEAHKELQEASVYSMRYAALEERTRLAREIHDGIGHQLTSLIVQLQALEIMLPGDAEKAAELVPSLLQVSRKAISEVRMAVREWSDDEMGLGLVALKGLVSQTQARSKIRFNFVEEGELSEWSTEKSITLYRVLQESLTNILRHSNASTVEVHIKEVNNNIVLTISDDGAYTEDNPITPGFGMKGIMERCNALGGSCRFSSIKPHGLLIEVTLPIEDDEDKE